MTKGIPVCIECGGPVNTLNEDEQGDPCPACAERLLETLPGVFHAPWGQETGQESEQESGVGEDLASHEVQLPSPGSRNGGDSFGEPRGSA